MKIERISENNIKVTISLNDLAERDIDVDALNYNSQAAQELFADVIEQAEVEFGFNTVNSQFMVDLDLYSEEGFIVNITKLDEEKDFESIQKYITNKLTKKDLKPKRKTRKVYSAISIYSFSSFENLCDLCQNTGAQLYGDSTLYKCRDTYYIIMTRHNSTSADVKMMETLIMEYGEKAGNSDFLEGYLNEYGELIIEHDAIGTIMKHFC